VFTFALFAAGIIPFSMGNFNMSGPAKSRISPSPNHRAGPAIRRIAALGNDAREQHLGD
jgi:hypothetical protein